MFLAEGTNIFLFIFMIMAQEEKNKQDHFSDEVYDEIGKALIGELDRLDFELEKALKQIKEWNRQDAKELQNLIKKLNSIMEKLGYEMNEWFDPAKIPTYDLPEDLKKYIKIWAVDSKGNCLVGSKMDKVIPGDKLRKLVANKLKEKSK